MLGKSTSSCVLIYAIFNNIFLNIFLFRFVKLYGLLQFRFHVFHVSKIVFYESNGNTSIRFTTFCEDK